MFLRKKQMFRIFFLFSLLVMTGTGLTQASKEIPYNNAAMKEDVVIQLNEAPELESSTIVGPGPQVYTFFFKEAVNRGTVEAAIRQNAKEAAKEDELRNIEPVFSFQWVHDRQLQVLVTSQAPLAKDGEWKSYLLSVAGAKTMSGTQFHDENKFWALVFAPSQIWRVSVDGKVKEKMTDFSVFMRMQFVDPAKRYVLLKRYTRYCECDARYPMLYSIYDIEKRESTPYPVELVDNYSGSGDFIADRRGFFFALPQQGVDVPKSEFASRVKVAGFVHGASFSHDRQHLFMAVGKAEQKKDLDLVVYEFSTGKELRRLPGVIKGWVPTDAAYGEVQPVSFTDDGRYVTFEMRTEEEGFEELRQRYDWKSGKVISWNPPVPKDAWSGYIQSSDGAYHMYWNAGLFKGDVKLMEVKPGATWIPGTHQLAYTDWLKAEHENESVHALVLFDADRKQQTVLAKGLPYQAAILGASEDGKWLYVEAEEGFAP